MKLGFVVLAGISLGCGVARAQQPEQEPPKYVPKVVPVPVPKGRLLIEPTTPAAQTFTDAHAHLSLRVPAGWNLNRRDGEVSTFHMDARNAPKTCAAACDCVDCLQSVSAVDL